MDCLFCRIIAGEIPAARVFEDEMVLAFADINPQAPVHLLIVPKKHVESLDALVSNEDGELLVGRMHAVAAQLARTRGLANGYRTVINTGRDGGQTVGHLHIHLLGGRPMHWPPG